VGPKVRPRAARALKVVNLALTKEGSLATTKEVNLANKVNKKKSKFQKTPSKIPSPKFLKIETLCKRLQRDGRDKSSENWL
jgi:hypothetical protein